MLFENYFLGYCEWNDKFLIFFNHIILIFWFKQVLAEFGDYNPIEHTPSFVSEFRFHPEQDEQMEIAILEKFIACR